MDPKDRVETLIKTTVSSVHKRVAGNDTPASGTPDPDEPGMVGAMAHQSVEKVKDTLGTGAAESPTDHP